MKNTFYVHYYTDAGDSPPPPPPPPPPPRIITEKLTQTFYQRNL